jgi:hypothetical protein
VVVLTLNGCAVSPYEKCTVSAKENSVLLENWPSNRSQLLSMFNQDIAPLSHAELTQLDQKEVWFRNSDGSLVFCRYLNKPNVCGLDGDFARFEQIDGAWKTDGLKSLICMKE